MVITGIGMLSAFANSLDELYTAIKSGVYAGGSTQMPVHEKDKRLLFADDLSKKAFLAADKAFSDSNTVLSCDYKDKAGIFLGNSFGSLKSQRKFEEALAMNDLKSAMPMDFVNTVMNAPAGQLAIFFGLEGMNVTTASGSRAAVDALIYADEMIREGRVCGAVTGGIEDDGPIYGEYIRQNGARPSDGICLFIAETRESAESRSAHIYAEFCGSAVGYKPGFDESDILSVMERAALCAGTELSMTDLVISSGDPAENRVISELGTDSIDIKKITGETYSASGAFAAAAAIAMITRKELPDGKRLNKRPTVLVNSFGFDGYMGCIALRGN